MAVDVYKKITAQIISSLESGVVPWRKPWSDGGSGFPFNLTSGKPYRGINVFLLGCAPYASPYWVTYRQAQAVGGNVRKGEKSTPVVFWKWLEKEDSESGKTERFPLLRYYSVFNSEQCDLPEGAVPDSPQKHVSQFERIAACEQVLTDMPSKPGIKHNSSAAFYRPSEDIVHMPNPEQFEQAEEYYSTLFHELVHSTGHASRLNRSGVVEATTFGSRTYGKEELVAEMGAAFLGARCGIANVTLDNSAAYIAGWLSKIREDKRMVVQAAAAGQKAADFVLNESTYADQTSNSMRMAA